MKCKYIPGDPEGFLGGKKGHFVFIPSNAEEKKEALEAATEHDKIYDWGIQKMDMDGWEPTNTEKEIS